MDGKMNQIIKNLVGRLIEIGMEVNNIPSRINTRWDILGNGRPQRSYGLETISSEADGDEKTDSDMPPIETLDETSDYSGFLSPKVSEGLRRAALRKLFQMPNFHFRDGLDDYDDDYRSFRVLGDIVTADMRHQMERHASKVRDRLLDDTPGEKIKGKEAITVSPMAAIATDGSEDKAGASKRKDDNPAKQDAVESPADSRSALTRSTAASIEPVRNPARLSNSIHDQHRPSFVKYQFEKPRYVNYSADICVHGNCGLRGCARCIDTCYARAITSRDDTIEIDHHLCQGCGSCASACPTGAISYACPKVGELLGSVQGALRRNQEADCANPCVLFHDAQDGAAAFARIASDISESVLPFQVEGIGSVGIEAWLAALASGADRVVLFATSATAPSVLREISTQLSYASAILEGMGYPAQRLQLIVGDDDNQEEVIRKINTLPVESRIEAATFIVFGDKRSIIRRAVEHLYAKAPAPLPFASLPAGAPFGEIEINRDACTLCMACVSVCKASALYGGIDRPQLRFIEANCVQCGLCHAACPEEALRLSPRIAYDLDLHAMLRVLNEETPFNCIICGRPFATQKIIDKMAEKLAGHWMLHNREAKRRLQMCKDCRVKDIFGQQEDIQINNKPAKGAGSELNQP
jgi:ferredoxin